MGNFWTPRTNVECCKIPLVAVPSLFDVFAPTVADNRGRPERPVDLKHLYRGRAQQRSSRDRI